MQSQDSRGRAGQLIFSISLVAAVWLLVISRWIIKDAVVPWDSKNQFYAFFRFLSATLRAGEWPLWNPYHYGGHPSVADPQSLVFSPTFVVWGALDPAPTMQAFDLVVFAHLLAGGIAIAIIGWRARWPVPGCVLAAALFMFGGAASGRLQHTGIILGYAAFPLALLMLQLALQRRSHAAAVGFAIAAACLALGRNQVALLLCILLLAAGVAEVWLSPATVRHLRDRLGVLTTIAVVCGALLVVPMLLTLQFADLSNRPAELMEDALRGSLHPANFATLLVPNIFDTHASYWGPGPLTLAEVALTDDSENYLFVGTVPVLLMLWLGVSGGGALRPGRRLMTGTLAIACLFMLGRYTPFYSLAFRFVPGIDLFRRPTDASFVFGVALAILTGHLLADYVREGLPRLRPLSTFAAVFVLLAVVGSAVSFSARTGHALEATREAAFAGGVMLVAALILLGARRPSARVAAACLVTLVAIAELIWWNAASRLNAQSRSLYAVLEAPTGTEAAAIARLDSIITEDHRRGDYPRVEVLGLGGPWQNLAMVRAWEATNGYNPLRVGIYDRLVAPGEENWDVRHRQFPPSFANYDCALAQALGLRYLVLGQSLDRLPALATPPAADLVLAGPPVWIYRLPGAMARVRIFAKPDVAANAAAADSPALGTSANPVPEGERMAPHQSAAPALREDRGVAKILSLAPGRVEAVVTSAEGGLLVLHDTYYPGWFAEVDDKPTPVLRAEILFRAVEVPAGTHRVSFRFAPFSLANLRAALNAALGRTRTGP
jgi:hypothetical protein